MFYEGGDDMRTITIEISEHTFKRLQQFAVPLIDTPDSTIGRALDALEARTRNGTRRGVETHTPIVEPLVIDPNDPPDLTHTLVTKASVGGRPVEAAWCGVVAAMLIFAHQCGLDIETIRRIGRLNVVPGERSDKGFRFVRDAALSVQGQDANDAFQAVVGLARALDVGFEVEFQWRDKEGAAHPGRFGRCRVEGGRNATVR